MKEALPDVVVLTVTSAWAVVAVPARSTDSRILLVDMDGRLPLVSCAAACIPYPAVTPEFSS